MLVMEETYHSDNFTVNKDDLIKNIFCTLLD